ncbi:DUF2927 domain-containing protein [Amorphus orientalis]|uniref:DUF2927 domain-containing protein n=1 Tax=Amorphus orientalis TaxID=649198 RepID=A0AAE3VR29_9HYPH|nr:DUF2927 domain-containing protein [Amorphus orientalis]MDQ0316625.1 hypothetical protein [Amorphus orientalis]
MRAVTLLIVGLLAVVPIRAAFAQDGTQASSDEPLTIGRVVNAFSDAELIQGFVRTVFGAEIMRRGQDPETFTTVKKFTGPVRVYIINSAERDFSRQVVEFIRILNQTVHGLSIQAVSSEERANMIVFLVDRAYYRKTIRETLPESFDTSFLRSNDCSAVTGGRAGKGLERAYVYIVANEGRRNFRHCMIEEITQSLGPVNDDVTLPHSIYNDSSRVQGFGVFDWFILSMLYDRRVKNGMTLDEVLPVLPDAIADSRRRLSGVLRTRKLISPNAR